MLYSPDIIVAQDRLFYDKVFKDPAWQQVKAVKEGKVYLIPRTPFNWFDRPPSFMRFLGLGGWPTIFILLNIPSIFGTKPGCFISFSLE